MTPVCRCHGKPMIKNGLPRGRQAYRCAVKAREYERYVRHWQRRYAA